MHSVQGLHIGRHQDGRNIAPVAGAVIAAHLPRLTGVYWSFDDNDKLDNAGRRARRDALARGLAHLPPSISRINFSLGYRAADQRYEHPKPLFASQSEGDANDHLSTALGDWVRRTPYVRLYGCITSAFWAALAGDRDNISDNAPAPTTIALHIEYTAISPTGHWFCEPPPSNPDDYGTDTSSFDSEYSEFDEEYDDPADYPRFPAQEDIHNRVCRVLVKPKLWRALLSAAAHAVAHLPALRILRITIPGFQEPAAEVVYDVQKRTLVFSSYIPDPPTDSEYKPMGPDPRTLLIMPGLFKPDPDIVALWHTATET